MSFNNYTKESFGKYIREKREEKKISLRDLSKQIGISPIYLSQIETGKRPAPIKNLEIFQAIMTTLNIPKEEIKLVIDMADYSKGSISNTYLEKNPAAQEFLREAINLDLTEDDWKNLTKQIRNNKSKILSKK